MAFWLHSRTRIGSFSKWNSECKLSLIFKVKPSRDFIFLEECPALQFIASTQNLSISVVQFLTWKILQPSESLCFTWKVSKVYQIRNRFRLSQRRCSNFCKQHSSLSLYIHFAKETRSTRRKILIPASKASKRKILRGFHSVKIFIRVHKTRLPKITIVPRSNPKSRDTD